MKDNHQVPVKVKPPGLGEQWYAIASITPQWLTYLDGRRPLEDEDGNLVVLDTSTWCPIITWDDPRVDDWAIDQLKTVIIKNVGGGFDLYDDNGPRPVEVVGHADAGSYAARIRHARAGGASNAQKSP